MAEIGETITVTCACGARLNAPLSAVGKVAPCPKCRAPLTVPAPYEADFGAAPEQFDYSMGRGIRNACIAGILGAALSTAIAMAVESEIGIVACAIGFACGFGMLLGTKRRAPECGIITCVITAAAILLSKVAIFVALSSMHSGEAAARQAQADSPQGQSQTQVVESLLAEEALADHEEDEDFTIADADQFAKERAAAMTPEQRKAYIQAREAAAERQSESSSAGVVQTVSFLLMFGMYDIIFFFLAMLCAYFTATFNDT